MDGIIYLHLGLMLREEGKYLAGKLMLSQMEKAANAMAWEEAGALLVAAAVTAAAPAPALVAAAAVCCCN